MALPDQGAEALDLVEVVDHDRPHARLECGLELGP
jgi:hypothetical protein